MFIEIFFPPSSGVERDEVEDAIGEELGDIVEVTGGGSGVLGSNLDVEGLEGTTAEVAVPRLRALLRRVRVPRGTTMRVDADRLQVHEPS